MSKNNNTPNHPEKKTPHELEWINLEEKPSRDAYAAGQKPRRPARDSKKPSPKKRKLNLHVIFLSLILLVFLIIALKLLFWDKRVRKDNEIESDTSLSFETEPLDSIVPLDSSGTLQFERDDELTILFLGNGSLADEKDSDTNMANIVQEKTGATVYNCAVPDSFLSMYNETYKHRYPYDAFSFYNLCTVFTVDNRQTISWAERDMGGLPDEINESLDLLESIDYSKLDILCVYYDASDCLEQRTLLDTDDPDTTGPNTFVGGLKSGIQLIQQTFPQVRIIVMSPTYAYVVGKDGKYESSLTSSLLETPLVEYVNFEQFICMQCNVSFVDNFYGTIHEKNADQYLSDNIHTNPEGNEKLADRFIYALNRFHEYDFPDA